MYVAKEDFILKISSGLAVLHLGCIGFTDLDGEAMRKRKLGNSVLEVSALGFGCMSMSPNYYGPPARGTK